LRCMVHAAISAVGEPSSWSAVFVVPSILPRARTPPDCRLPGAVAEASRPGWERGPAMSRLSSATAAPDHYASCCTDRIRSRTLEAHRDRLRDADSWLPMRSGHRCAALCWTPLIPLRSYSKIRRQVTIPHTMAYWHWDVDCPALRERWDRRHGEWEGNQGCRPPSGTDYTAIEGERLPFQRPPSMLCALASAATP